MPSRDSVQTLILDTAPLLNSPLASLLPIASRFVTTSDIVDEVRNKGQRERIEMEWGSIQAVAGSSRAGQGEEGSGGDADWQGLKLQQPSAEGIAKITAFARQTGDIAVLSSADIRVLALAYDVEVEANGTWRLRDRVGGKRIGKDPEKKQARLERRKAAKPEPEAREGEERRAVDEKAGRAGVQGLKGAIDGFDVHSEAAASEATPLDDGEEPAEDPDDADWSHIPIKSRPSALAEDDGDGDDDDDSIASESDPTWITPENVHLHKARDMGIFSPLGASSGSASPAVARNLQSASTTASTSGLERSDEASSSASRATEKGPTMKAALLTGDYAMQNVALQIGLNVLGDGGKRIRDVKTWVLRCYGCFKICKDATRKFCPSCGGATLTRVAITYTPSSPTGYILHLKQNFQYRNRGAIYSIPSAKPGSASFEKGGARKQLNGASLVLREDQKEFQRGLKSASVAKQKEERREARAAARGEDPFSPFGGWNDPDWQPPMLLGEKGRKGGKGGSAGTRMGKDGLPVIGFGKNPNEVRKHR